MPVIPKELINQTPGFTGELVDWILQTSMYPQPQLALAAALAAVGTLKGHKVASETDLRTNQIVVGLGLPSSGKGHALNCISKLFTAIGAEGRLSGKPVSDAGLLTALESSGGVSLVLWDEFGLGLSKITHIRAPIYKSNIMNVIMELFSAANSHYRGNEYANRDGKNPRVDILEPCFSIYGATTPVRFIEALNGDLVSDGFLSRLLIFDAGPKRPEAEDRTEELRVPKSLIDRAKAILKEPQASDGSIEGHGVVRVVPYTDGARVRFYDLINQFHEMMEGDPSETIQSIYGRSVEHIVKIALTVEPTKKITRETLDWAGNIHAYLRHTLIALIKEDINNSQSEIYLKKVLNVFNGKPISHGELTRATQSLTQRERAEALKTLEDSERLRVFKEIIGDSHKATTFYELIKGKVK